MAIAPNMFGIDPMAYQQQQNQQDFNQAVQYAALDPFQRATAGVYQGAKQFGRAAQGLLGMEDPQLAASREAQSLMGQFDPTTSEGLKGLSLALMQRAQATNSPVLAGLAQQAASQYQKAILNEATVEQKTREKMPNIGEQVNQGLYAQALKDAKGDPILAAKLYNDREQAEKKGVAQAGVAPSSGQVPLTTLKDAVNLVNEFTAKPKAKLEQISVLGQTGQALKNNSTLLPQFKREAVKFAGDNQIGQKEVKDILGSAGIAGDTIDGVNAFLTGAPTNAKIDDVLRGFQVLEKAYAEQYNTGRKKAETVLTEGKINEQTRNAVLPPAYKVAQPPAGDVPALGVWLVKARASNPGVNDADLTTYYNTKYGKKQ